MRRLISSLVLAACTIAPVVPAIAQSPRRINPTEFPSQGATIQAFVPKGWKVEAKIDGDLNADQQSDTALRLIETTGDDRARVLLVLQKQSNGQWRRLGIAPRLLLCSNCGGLFGTPDGANVQVRIKNGVLAVRQFRGSREVTDTLHRFSLDKSTNRLVLIDQEMVQRDRLTGDATLERSNFLTGEKIIQKYRANQQRTGTELVSRRRSTIAKTKSPIETIDIEAIQS